jgi:hypothetical protein
MVYLLVVATLASQPIAFTLRKSKHCNYCIAWKKRHQDDEDFEDLEPPEHNCTNNNHKKSSLAMESHACLDMVVTMYDKYSCIMDQICVDDDGATCALLKWSNEDYMVNTNTTTKPTILISCSNKNAAGKPKPCPNRGLLPGHIPQAYFHC